MTRNDFCPPEAGASSGSRRGIGSGGLRLPKAASTTCQASGIAGTLARMTWWLNPLGISCTQIPNLKSTTCMMSRKPCCVGRLHHSAKLKSRALYSAFTMPARHVKPGISAPAALCCNGGFQSGFFLPHSILQSPSQQGPLLEGCCSQNSTHPYISAANY